MRGEAAALLVQIEDHIFDSRRELQCALDRVDSLLLKDIPTDVKQKLVDLTYKLQEISDKIRCESFQGYLRSLG